MIGFGLPTMVINTDTIAQARTTLQYLWIEAQTDPDIILLSPEKLGSWESFHLLNNDSFTARVCILGSVRKSGSVRFFGPISTDRNRNRLPIMADIR